MDFFLGKPRTIYISCRLQGKFSIDPSLTVTQQPAKENEKNWYRSRLFFSGNALGKFIEQVPRLW